MCKEMCKEKCELCGKLDLSCCEMTPMWREDELAYFNYKSDYLGKVNNEVKVSFLKEYNKYIITKRNDIKNDKVLLTNTCIFYDEENHKCRIYEYRPEQCRSYGSNENPCIFTGTSLEKMENIKFSPEEKFNIKLNRLNKYGKEQTIITGYMLPKIKAFSKKDTKNMKEDMLLYLMLNSINNLRDMWEDNPYIKFKYEYGLIFVDYKGRKALNSARYTKAYTDIPELKSIAVAYNKLNRRFVLKDPMYTDLLVQKLRRIMKGVTLTEVGTDDRDILSYIGSFIPLIDVHKNDFKLKNFKDLINEDDLYRAKKWLLNLKDGTIFNVPDEIEALYTNADRIFKAIMKQK